jgi:acyl-coenzyme A synthetase/AMP-(fatty) acid ligase
VTAFDVAGAVLPSRLAREARLHLTPNLMSNYGATESGWAAIGDAALGIAEPGAVGYVLPWLEVETVDADDRPLAAGQEGALRLRGPQVVMRYHNADATTARVFRDGWFYPGDLGVLSQERLLRITGRVDETIRQGDRRVSPLMLEEAMRALAGVRDVAVFGFAEPAGAEAVWAALVLDPGTDVAHVRAEAVARLGERAPTRWLVVDRLPRGPHDKLLRSELIALARRDRSVDRITP